MDEQPAVSVLADRLREEILQRGLAPGDLFMKEEEICARHAVSRTLAREAVSQLRALGILISRQGKGLLVGGVDSVGVFSKTLPFVSNSPEDLRQLAELRFVLEVGSIELAVRSARDSQVQQLVELAAQFNNAVERGDVEEETRIELAFHGLILTMTGNPLVAGMHDVIARYFHAESDHYVAAARDAMRASAREHSSIASAIAAGDVELARAFLRQHLGHIKQGHRK